MQAWYNLLADKFKDGCLPENGGDAYEDMAKSSWKGTPCPILNYCIVILIVGLALLSQDNKK